MFLLKFLMVFGLYILLFNSLFLGNLYFNNDPISVVVKNNLEIENNYFKFISSYNGQKFQFIYFFSEEKTDEEIFLIEESLKYGSILTIDDYEVSDIENKFRNDSSFNYENYMLSKRVNKEIHIQNFTFEEYAHNIFYFLKNLRVNIIRKVEEVYPNNYMYINSLVFGEGLDDDLKDSIQDLGIIQLFTISGMHINFLIKTLEYILKKFKLKDSYIDFFLVLFLPIYGIFCNMGLSVKRAIEMKILKIKFKNSKVGTLDIFFLVFLFNIFLNPYNLLNVGFLFSYLITLFLILNKEIFMREEIFNELQNYLVLTFCLPFSISLSHSINLFLVFSLYFYNRLVQLMLLLSFLLVFFINVGAISVLFNTFMNFLVWIFNVFNYLNYFFVIKIKSLSLLFMLFYYYFYFEQIKEIYYFRLTSFKYIKILIILIIFLILGINILGEVDIIDVGQGDSILIQYPLKGGTILIDTGDVSAKDEEIDFLNSKGIRIIDYLIISHNHADHNANLEDIIKNFKVKNLVISESYYEEEKYYFDSLLEVNILKINGLEDFPFGYVYSPLVYSSNENNNSLIVYATLGREKWLFVGDCEIDEEKELINNYDINVDYLKAGHHGSKTATSQDFLDATTPDEVFISSGRDNRYGHPSEEVLDRLEYNNIPYFDTQTDGEIKRFFL